MKFIKLGIVLITIFAALVYLYANLEKIVYLSGYIKTIVNLILIDNERRENNFFITADIYWKHFQLQLQFMENICKERGGSRRDYLWLTALVNDEYAIPAVVLGYSLQSLSCIKNMVVLASPDVSQPARQALTKVGWHVKVVTTMDCSWMEKKLGQAPSGEGIKGTHTRFHAWNYTHYSKIIYADPDFMPLSNIDDLFEVKADFAASFCNRPGIFDPCFNAGLMVFKPSSADHKAIMDNWFTRSKQGTCPDDQRLLYYHYAFNGKWKQLPFAYNVRRIIHYPMKAFHFVCCPPKKPWKTKCRPTRDEARSFNRGIRNLRDMTLVYWKKFYFALKKYNIDEWYRRTKYYHAEMEFGKHLYKDCWEDLHYLSYNS